MLDVVESPILVQQPAFRLQAAIETGVRKRRRHGIARQIDLGPVHKLHGALENALVVVVEAEDEAALDADAVVMQLLDDLAILHGGMEVLVRLVERVLADRLEADEQALATALRGE